MTLDFPRPILPIILKKKKNDTFPDNFQSGGIFSPSQKSNVLYFYVRGGKKGFFLLPAAFVLVFGVTDAIIHLSSHIYTSE